jgi:hypothetical protein
MSARQSLRSFAVAKQFSSALHASRHPASGLTLDMRWKGEAHQTMGEALW